MFCQSRLNTVCRCCLGLCVLHILITLNFSQNHHPSVAYISDGESLVRPPKKEPENTRLSYREKFFNDCSSTCSYLYGSDDCTWVTVLSFFLLCLSIILISIGYYVLLGHAVAQLVEPLRCKSEGRGFDFRWCHWSLWSRLSPTEMSIRNISWRVKAVGAWGWQPYHLHVPIVLKSGSFILLEPSGPV